MSMKKWTDEELVTTRDNLEAWNSRSSSTAGGSKMWLFTAFLGAFAISTGFAFILLDGVTVLSILLIVMGTITCISWYKSDKRRKDNIAFLADINKEIKSRKIKDAPKAKGKSGDAKPTESTNSEQKDLTVTDSLAVTDSPKK